MWKNIGIKNQKVKKSKLLICSNSKSNLEMQLLPEDIIMTPWRSMQRMKDEKHVKKIISCEFRGIITGQNM